MTIAFIVTFILGVSYFALAEKRIRGLKRELADMTDDRDRLAQDNHQLKFDCADLSVSVGAARTAVEKTEAAAAADRAMTWKHKLKSDEDYARATAADIGEFDACHVGSPIPCIR